MYIDNKGTIFLMDNIEVSKKKIMSSKTDNFNKVHFDEDNQPESNFTLNTAFVSGKNKIISHFSLDASLVLG